MSYIWRPSALSWILAGQVTTLEDLLVIFKIGYKSVSNGNCYSSLYRHIQTEIKLKKSERKNYL